MNTKKLTFISVCVALAMILSYIESLIPPFVAVPGVKVGLANTVSLFILYAYGVREAACVSFIRVCLSALLFGSSVSFIYSLSGAVLSLLGMIILKRIPIFTITAVSVVGAVLHNAAQIICACLLMENAAIAYYLPVLVIAGTVAGVAIGVLAALLMKKLEKIIK